jgi:hypothetical protein
MLDSFIGGARNVEHHLMDSQSTDHPDERIHWKSMAVEGTTADGITARTSS